MGVTVKAQTSDVETDYEKALVTYGNLLIHRIMRPWLWTSLTYSLFESSKANHYHSSIKTLHTFTDTVPFPAFPAAVACTDGQ